MKKLLLLATLASTSAFGGVLTVTCPTVIGSTELGPGANGTISCADFNLSGQILNSISLTITGGIVNQAGYLSTITITNNDNVSHSGSGTTTSGFSLDSSTPLPGFSFVLDGNGNLITVVAGTGPQTLTANQSKTFNVSGTTSSTAVDTTQFAPYIGSGSFNISADTLSGFGVTGGGGQFAGSQTTFASLGATVTYNYSAPSTTPEPATMTLFGSALLGIGFFARKRIKKS